MSKLTQAQNILKQVGMPEEQQNEIAAYTLLTLAHITGRMKWGSATNEWIRIHDVLLFTEAHFKKKYAENTRENIRKHCMHPFREAALVEDNGKATNSPNYRYRLTEEALLLLQSYGTATWKIRLAEFLAKHTMLKRKYAGKRKIRMLPVHFKDKSFELSFGRHNKLQKAVLEEFAPRFAPGADCLYVGDTTDKDLLKDTETLAKLGFEITLHDKMPDVVLYRADKDWLYLVEAVESTGPVSPQRKIELEKMMEKVSCGKIYVTAFLDFETYKKFASQLAWETEVWIAAMPDHMIHLNGDKFLGPR